jgi:hypothetical protein
MVQGCSAGEEIPHFYGSRRLSTVFSKARIGPSPNPLQCSAQPFIVFSKINFNIVLHCKLCVCCRKKYYFLGSKLVMRLDKLTEREIKPTSGNSNVTNQISVSLFAQTPTTFWIFLLFWSPHRWRLTNVIYFQLTNPAPPVTAPLTLVWIRNCHCAREVRNIPILH